MQAQPDGQLSLTDPDSRSMKSNGRGSGVVGYNVQTAVEPDHHLIVSRTQTSELFMPQALTSISTSPAAGRGTGTSSR